MGECKVQVLSWATSSSAQGGQCSPQSVQRSEDCLDFFWIQGFGFLHSRTTGFICGLSTMDLCLRGGTTRLCTIVSCVTYPATEHRFLSNHHWHSCGVSLPSLPSLSGETDFPEEDGLLDLLLLLFFLALELELLALLALELLEEDWLLDLDLLDLLSDLLSVLDLSALEWDFSWSHSQWQACLNS